MKDTDDDFGELYGDFELEPEPTSSINDVLEINNTSFNDDMNLVTKDENPVSENESESETDDDFDIVVNDEDFDGGVVCREPRDGDEDELVTEGNNNRVRAENGGERVNVVKNNFNTQYKYIRQHGSVYTGNQKSVSFGGDDGEDSGYTQHRRPGLGRVGPSYAGYTPGLAEHGNGFWLPWYRTILDVDIDTFEQKPWTFPGADITDYFNFGFDEESWKCYRHLVDQLRHQTLLQSRNQLNESSRTKLENEASAGEEIEAEENGNGRLTSQVSESSMRQFKRQIGRPIHVEDNNAERQPSMGSRASRYRDSDVVIEITVQDSEHSSSCGKENSDDANKTEHKISENGCDFENVEPIAEISADSKHCEMEKDSCEENKRSASASSERKRSYESATVSSHILQASSSLGKTQNSECDTLQSGEAAIVSKEKARSVDTVNTFSKDADRNSAETNPCVADIDLLYSDHIRSSPTLSESDGQSKASDDGDHHDFRRTEVGRRSPSYSVMEEHRVVKDGRRVSRHKQRDAVKLKSTVGKYRSRVRSPIEEDWKHPRQRVHRHSELNSYRGEDDDYHIRIEGRMCGRNSRAHHHRSKERVHTTSFDDEDWPNCGEKKSSFSFHDKMLVEKQFQGASMREPHLQDHWKPKDERGSHFQREWDEEEFFWERRTRQPKGETVEREWYLHERECMIRDGKPKFHISSPSFSKYSSSSERLNSGRDYDDFPFSKRSKRDMSLDYGYSDGLTFDRDAGFYPLNDKEHVDLDYEYERRLRHLGKEVATSGRVDQYLEYPSLDLDYPWCDRGGDEYSRRKTSRYTHDHHDRHPSYAEKRYGFTLEKDDVDDPQLFDKYGRLDRYVPPRKGRDHILHFQDRKDAYSRRDTARYCEDDYFGKTGFKGMNCIEDGLPSRYFDDSYGENMCDSLKDVARHKWHGSKSGFAPGEMSIHTQNMKHKHRILEDVGGGGGKFFEASSTVPTRVEHKQTGLWYKNSMEVHHVVRERKLTGKFSRSGNDTVKDAVSIADRIVEKQPKFLQKVNEPVTYRVMENKGQIGQALQKDSFPNKNQYFASDLEDGQIPTTEISKEKKCGRLVQNESRVYDESRILEAMAKMEKRRERFKKPMLLKETGSDLKPDDTLAGSDPKPDDTLAGSDPKPDDILSETAELKLLRPARKRRWGGL